MAEEKVTIRFSMDDTPDKNGDILIEGPIKVFTSVDEVSDLVKLNDLPTDEDVYVCVKNTAKTSETQKYQRPSYYLHSCSDNIWTEVLVGTHSHENKDLLDDLGQLDVTELSNGINKLLTVEKLDYNTNDRKYKYQFKWKDLPRELPEIPEDLLDKPVTLSYVDGKYEWSDKLIPAQTFQYAVKTIAASTFAREQNPTLTEEERLNQIIENVSYSKDKGDQALIFINGSFLTNYTIEPYNIDGVDYKAVKITLNTDNIDEMFDIGDILTIIVIKAGAAGYMDTVRDQYVTYDDLIKFIRDGIKDDETGEITHTLDLKNYATKKELEEKADVNHNHTRYSSIGHDHDLIYAPYYHIHNEYVTAEELKLKVLEEIGKITINGSVTEDSIINAVEGILNTQQESFNNLLENTHNSLKDLQTQIGALSADDISYNKDTTRPLSDYLAELQRTVDEIISSASSVISEDLVIGTDVGNVKSGDIIPAKTTYESVFRRLLLGTRPSIRLTASLSDPRPKKSNTLSLRLDYNKGSGCEIENAKITIKGLLVDGVSKDIILSDLVFDNGIYEHEIPNVKTTKENVKITAEVFYSEYAEPSKGIYISEGRLEAIEEIKFAGGAGGASSLIKSDIAAKPESEALSPVVICSDLTSDNIITKIIYKINKQENFSPNLKIKLISNDGETIISEVNDDMFICSDNTDYVIYEESLYQPVFDDSYVVAENDSNVNFTIYIEVQEIETM